jgi:GGDEF domain-containing protein
MFPDDAQRQEALLEAADNALYRAKEAGRNCVRVAAA